GVGEEEHLPRSQGGARERDELLGQRLHERRRQGGNRGVQGEAEAAVEGALSGTTHSKNGTCSPAGVLRVSFATSSAFDGGSTRIFTKDPVFTGKATSRYQPRCWPTT